MGLVVIRINSKGVEEILKSQRVQADLLRRAEAIASAANSAAGLADGFIAAAETGKSRARASVVTATADAMVAEARDRVLTRAFDAGRG